MTLRSRHRGRWHAAALVVAALLVTPRAAHAYCRRSSCDGVARTVCVPARADDCGVPVHWPAGPVPYQVARSDEPLRRAAIAAIDRAFSRWRTADCGDGRHPDLAIAGRITDGDPPPGRGAPVGLIAFSDEWPERGGGTLAITRLYFGPASGEVLRARTIFYTSQLAPHGEGSSLASTALHEAGHFLGLAHSPDPAAVMSEEVHGGATMPTELAPDDIAAICAVFPPRDRSHRLGTAALALAAIAACAAGWLLRRRIAPTANRPLSPSTRRAGDR